MKRYFINYKGELKEDENGNLISTIDYNMMKIRMKWDSKAKIKELEDQIQILR